MNDRLTSSTLKTSAWLEPHARLGISLMDHLFNRLDGAYPNKWRASFKTEQAISNWRESWAEAFDEEGITTQMISDGIRRCRKLFDWPPSLTEFLKACKPPIDIDAAVYEAIAQMRARQEARDVWSDPAIFWAAARVGEFDMLSQTFAQLKPRFESELRKVLETVVQPVPARVPMLAAPSKSESTANTAGRSWKNSVPQPWFATRRRAETSSGRKRSSPSTRKRGRLTRTSFESPRKRSST